MKRRQSVLIVVVLAFVLGWIASHTGVLAPAAALSVGTQVHNAPEAFAKVMSVVKPRMAVTEEHTWSPPLAAPAEPPSLDDRTAFGKSAGLTTESMAFSDFTKSGYMDVDDVLRPIFAEASEVFGREFPYPGDE